MVIVGSWVLQLIFHASPILLAWITAAAAAAASTHAGAGQRSRFVRSSRHDAERETFLFSVSRVPCTTPKQCVLIFTRARVLKKHSFTDSVHIVLLIAFRNLRHWQKLQFVQVAFSICVRVEEQQEQPAAAAVHACVPLSNQQQHKRINEGKSHPGGALKIKSIDLLESLFPLICRHTITTTAMLSSAGQRPKLRVPFLCRVPSSSSCGSGT